MIPLPSTRARWLPELAGGWAYWLAFLLLLEIGNVAMAPAQHQSLSLETVRILGASLLGASTAPPLLWIVRRFSLNGPARWRHLLIQLGAAGLTAILLLLIGVAVGAAIGVPQRSSLEAEFAANGGLMFYCVFAFVAGGNLMRPARRTAESAPRSEAQAADAPSFQRTWMIKEGHSRHAVSVDRIAWIESQGNYVSLHCDGANHLVRETLSSVEKKIDPLLFRRIHRGAIVRLDHIVEISPLLNGDQRVTLRDGTELRASRTYRDGLPPLTPKVTWR